MFPAAAAAAAATSQDSQVEQPLCVCVIYPSNLGVLKEKKKREKIRRKVYKHSQKVYLFFPASQPVCPLDKPTGVAS